MCIALHSFSNQSSLTKNNNITCIITVVYGKLVHDEMVYSDWFPE